MDTLRRWYEQVALTMDVKLLNLLSALAILVLGYIVAAIVSVLIRSVLKRVRLNERAKGVLSGVDAESGIGTIVFYLLMAFVLIAFFQTLNLEKVNEPLSKLLESIFLFLPKVVAAGVLAFIAWVIARIAAAIVRKALEAAKVDEWLSAKAGVESGAAAPAAKAAFTATIANCVYGIVILLFLPTILEALGMTNAMQPFNNLINQIVGFLPNLLSAIVILFVGIFVAKFVKQIVTGLLSAAGADRLALRLGIGRALGKGQFSALLGGVVYILILLPFVVASLDALNMKSVSLPASLLLAKVLNSLPNIFGACLVLGVAYVIGTLVSGLIVNLLQGAGFDNILVVLRLQKTASVDARKPSQIAGSVLTAAIVMYAAVEAARLLGFETIAAQLGELIVFFGHILMGLIVMAVGLFVANYAAGMIRESDTAGAEQFAVGVHIGVIVLFAGMALRQMNIANDIINIGYASILGGVGLAFALGVGLSFGLGARETAGQVARKWHRASVEKEDGGEAAA